MREVPNKAKRLINIYAVFATLATLGWALYTYSLGMNYFLPFLVIALWVPISGMYIGVGNMSTYLAYVTVCLASTYLLAGPTALVCPVLYLLYMHVGFFITTYFIARTIYVKEQ